MLLHFALPWYYLFDWCRDIDFLFFYFNHSDAFNYPFGSMWTAVLGEHDRNVEEGSEQRLMVEKVILHERFKEYHNDIG